MDNLNEKSKKKNKNNSEPEQIVVTDKILYIISDRITPNLVEYSRECGLNVTNVYDKVDVIRNIRLMQFMPARIVVIDSGTGKFVSPNIRRDLIDLLGMSDEETQFTVFYTDDIIRSNAIEDIGKDNKFVEWFKYDNTVSCIARMLSHKDEKYLIDNDTAYENSSSRSEEILNMMGKETPGAELEKLGTLSINPASIRGNNEMDYEKIRGFEVKL